MAYVLDLKMNNNIFSPSGRITRLPFFITSLVLILCCLVGVKILTLLLGVNALLFVFLYGLFLTILQLFAIIKRLRDIKCSFWVIITIFIPYVSFVIFIWLFLAKSKYE